MSLSDFSRRESFIGEFNGSGDEIDVTLRNSHDRGPRRTAPHMKNITYISSTLIAYFVQGFW